MLLQRLKYAVAHSSLWCTENEGDLCSAAPFCKLLFSLGSEKSLTTPCCKNKMIDLGLHFTVPQYKSLIFLKKTFCLRFGGGFIVFSFLAKIYCSYPTSEISCALPVMLSFCLFDFCF